MQVCKCVRIPVALGTHAAAEAFNDLFVPLVVVVVVPASFDTVVVSAPAVVDAAVSLLSLMADVSDDAAGADTEDLVSDCSPLFSLFLILSSTGTVVVSTVVVDSMIMMLFLLMMIIAVDVVFLLLFSNDGVCCCQLLHYSNGLLVIITLSLANS